jgi:hypothetical protein
MNKLYTIAITLLLFTSSLFGQNTTIVRQGNNNTPITQVTYAVDGNLVTQNTPHNNGHFSTSDVILKSIQVNDNGTAKTLQFFNLGGIVTNNNFQTNTTGVGVYNDGNMTPASNRAAFESAINDMSSDSSLLHMLVYDRTSNIPNGNDFDINWNKGLTNDDFIVLGERNGNSRFTIIPLDQNGNIIVGANYIQFRSRYDWNTGFAPRNVPNQPMHLSVVKVDQFNTSTPVFGFRIDNNGEADIRFFMMGDNTFENNPSNSLPIELVSFDGNVNQQNIDLAWTTGSEINGDFFEVQYSTDGIQFHTIDHIDAVGESVVAQYYAYTHEGVTSGINYYRLKMVDNDETFEYSRTIAITKESMSDKLINLYPNPTTNQQVHLSFEYTSDRVIQFINNTGIIVHQINTTDRITTINLSNLPLGLYQVLITDQNIHTSVTRTLLVR